MEKPLVIQYPIIHTEGEVGYKGSDRVTALDEVTQPLWRAIKEDLLSRSLDYRKVNVYEDGMTIGEEKKPGGIVSALADFPPNSPNLEMLRFLISQGASLVGLERDELVAASLIHRQLCLEADIRKDKRMVRHHWGEFKRLAGLRDQAIPERIRQTLPPDRIGILFLGDSHKIKPHSRGLRIITPPVIQEASKAAVRRYSELRKKNRSAE